MVTRASTRKDSPAKSGAKPEPAAQKSAARKTTTDLISPKTKKPATETKLATEDKHGKKGVPPISKAKAREPVAARSEPAPAPPPPKPETVSLIEEKRPKKPETAAGSETRSVLPPISQIRAPRLPEIATSKPPGKPEPETAKEPAIPADKPALEPTAR